MLINPFGTRMFLLCLLFMWQWLESYDPPFDARVWNSGISMLEYRLNKKECCLLLCPLCTPGCQRLVSSAGCDGRVDRENDSDLWGKYLYTRGMKCLNISTAMLHCVCVRARAQRRRYLQEIRYYFKTNSALICGIFETTYLRFYVV